MTKPLHLIYVPGLGAGDYSGQKWAVRRWKRRNVTSELFAINWDDKQPWAPKFRKLLALIDQAAQRGNDVALVGASAGASAVINAYAARKSVIVGVVCIAGKINHPETVGPRYKARSPAFVSSIQDCSLALASLDAADLARVMSRYGLLDEIVRRSDSYLNGARNRFSPTIGHAITIAYQIILGAPSFIRWLQRQAKQGL